MSFDPLQILAGAALGFAGTGALRWWQYQRDFLLQRVEKFCESVEEAADLSVKYWVIDSSTPTDETVNKQIIELEARIIGMQVRIDENFASIIDRLIEKDAVKLRDNLNSFTEALTGGDFQVANRPMSVDYARNVQEFASKVIAQSRIAVHNAYTIRGCFIHMYEAGQRRQTEAGAGPWPH